MVWLDYLRMVRWGHVRAKRLMIAWGYTDLTRVIKCLCNLLLESKVRIAAEKEQVRMKAGGQTSVLPLLPIGHL
jgi:hypothetical protein